MQTRSFLPLRKGLREPELIAKRILNIHFSISPCLVYWMHPHVNTLFFVFLMERVHIANEQNRYPTWYAIAGKGREMKPQFVTRDDNISRIGTCFVYSIF